MCVYRVKTSGKRERTRFFFFFFKRRRILNAHARRSLNISFDYIRHVTTRALLRRKKKKTPEPKYEPTPLVYRIFTYTYVISPRNDILENRRDFFTPSVCVVWARDDESIVFLNLNGKRHGGADKKTFFSARVLLLLYTQSPHTPSEECVGGGVNRQTVLHVFDACMIDSRQRCRRRRHLHRRG